jgi:CDP-diacylglycerol--glycerol-3-phosphate 3-phosphatidyltransferase
MTTANKVTIFRMLLIPFFVVEVLYYGRNGQDLHRWLAVASFGLASICDGVDGYIARKFDQRSELGAILDPLADKLLLVSGIILLSLDHEPHFQTIPLWVTGTILGRDCILLLGWIVIQLLVGKVKVHARMVGKVATVLQMAMVLWILLLLEPRWLRYITGGAALCTAVSGLLYILDGVRQLSSHPSSLPLKPENGRPDKKD